MIAHKGFQQSSQLLLRVGLLIPKDELETLLHVEVEQNYDACEFASESGSAVVSAGDLSDSTEVAARLWSENHPPGRSEG